MYEALATNLDQAARLLLGKALPPEIGVRDAHVAYFYRQSFEVIFRALATHAEANALITAARIAVEQGAGKQIAYVIMTLQLNLGVCLPEQVYKEAGNLLAAWEQVVEATHGILGADWPEGPFPNYFEIGFAHRPRS